MPLVATVGDPAATRVVYGVVIALAVLGVVLVGLAIWLIRSTKVDLEMLAPLERMGERSWRKRDPATQQRMLDEVRPEGAEPLWRADPAPDPDEEFDEVPISAGFDDLQDDALPSDDAPSDVDAPADESADVDASADDESGVEDRPVDDDANVESRGEPTDDEGAGDAGVATDDEVARDGELHAEEAELETADAEADVGDEPADGDVADEPADGDVADEPADEEEPASATLPPPGTPEINGVVVEGDPVDDDRDAGEEPVEVGR